MKRALYSFFTILTLVLFSFEVRAGGLDMDLLYGSRYVAVGGNHVTMTNDAYGIFYNPATMAYAQRPMFAFDSSTLIFQNEAPINAANAQRKSDLNIGPLFYAGAVYPWTDRIAFGFAAYPTSLQGGKFSNVDYGSSTGKEYSNKLVRIEFSPAVALKLAEHFSVGATYKIAYTRYDKFGGTPTGIMLKSSVSGWDAQGLKFGMLAENLGGFNFGLTYRPSVQIELSGTTNVTVPSLIPGLDDRTTQKLTLASQLQAGLSYEWIPNRLMTVFTYEYTENSTLEADEPVLATLLPASQTRTPLHYKDGHAFHLGTEYTSHLSNQRKMRYGGGLVYDKGVSRRAEPNPVLPPAGGYVGYSIGTQYDTGKHVFGIALNYGEQSHTTSAAEIDPTLTSAFPGKYQLKIFLASVDYQFRF